MSAAEWKARTGDDAFVDDLVTLVRALMGAADKGDTAAVAKGIAGLQQRLASMAGEHTAAANEEEQDRHAASRAMIEQCIAGLEAIAAPDPDGIGAYLNGLAEEIGWIAAATTVPPTSKELAAAAAEADQAAARIAADIVRLEPQARRVVLGAALPPAGLAIVFEKIASADRPMIAADIAAANAEFPAYRDALCGAAVARAAQAAAGPAEALVPEGAASVLLAAFADSPAVAACAGKIANAAPTDLPALVAAVEAVAVPSAVSRRAAVVHAALEERFGTTAATDMTRGYLLLRILGPSLPATLTARIERLLGGTPPPADIPIDDALIRYTEHVVAAGIEAAEIAAAGSDPDDIVVMRGNALLSAEDLVATFMAPTPPDPLGTLPANPVTILGQAILKARAARPGGYRWAEVQALAERDMDLYLALIEDERAKVMDRVEIPGGLRIEEQAAKTV